uniref:Uncharacterized protein n=1 Tax=Pyxicephalus adspersus TaxID=30357 RepID=A0AAV3AU85_PYXAD|nr:TPA: hypothetical protein GDO54_006147 [Pyxicephalus adspersus]
MNFPPIENGPKGNLTLRQLEDAVDSGLWEPQTVIIVVIFGLVCFLHLTAFLYTVCLQSYIHAGTQTFARPVLQVKKDGGGKKCFHLLSQWLNDNCHTPQKEKTLIIIDM